jgi:hypothetical protein
VATAAEIATLRGLLGESIPEDGDETDTMFSDADLGVLIDEAPNMDRAAMQGWRNKAANFANLVNVVDGASSRDFSDLLDNAMQMVKLYTRSDGSGLTQGRTTIGRSVRR